MLPWCIYIRAVATSHAWRRPHSHNTPLSRSGKWFTDVSIYKVEKIVTTEEQADEEGVKNPPKVRSWIDLIWLPRQNVDLTVAYRFFFMTKTTNGLLTTQPRWTGTPVRTTRSRMRVRGTPRDDYGEEVAQSYGCISHE